jgi:hypothetical protein
LILVRVSVGGTLEQSKQWAINAIEKTISEIFYAFGGAHPKASHFSGPRSPASPKIGICLPTVLWTGCVPPKR